MALHLTPLARAQRTAGIPLSIFLGALAAGLLLAAGRLAYAGTCSTTVNPGDSIQAAINCASPGDTVVINAGAYTESLTLNKAVSLAGANSATTFIQAAAGQRVITVSATPSNATFLISDLTFQGGNVAGGTLCPQNCGGGMLILTGTASPRLQNLIVRNNAAYMGGGLFAGTNLTVTGALFTNNTASLDGGGLHVANSVADPAYRLVISGSQFISNTSQGDGGGLYVFGTAIVSNSWFERNRSLNPGRGGGLTSRYLTMTNTSFYSNTAFSVGGGAYNTVYADVTGGVFQGNTGVDGGGLSVRGDLHLTGTQFISNTSVADGGGLYLDFASTESSVSGARFERNACTFNACRGGGLATNNFFVLLVDGTDFLTNTTRGSGGGLSTGASLTLTNSLLRANTCTQAGCRGGGLSAGNLAFLSGVRNLGNTAQSGGGGAFFPGAAIILDSVFLGNQCQGASCTGGAVLAEQTLALTSTQLISNTSLGAGGGLAQQGAGDLRIVNSLFARNTAGAPGLGLWAASPGSGVVLHTTFANALAASGAAVGVANGSLGLTNTIVASYTTGISLTSGSAYEDYTLFFGVATTTAGGVTGGSHHPTGDPKFANPAADNYHLRTGSPAIDAGANEGVLSDFEGDLRPLDLGFDLGYDEYALMRLYLPLVMK